MKEGGWGSQREESPCPPALFARVAEARGWIADQPPTLWSHPLTPGPPPGVTQPGLPNSSRPSAQAPGVVGPLLKIKAPACIWSGAFSRSARGCFCPAFLTHQSAAPPWLVDCSPYPHLL